jgi:hypothetical protein
MKTEAPRLEDRRWSAGCLVEVVLMSASGQSIKRSTRRPLHALLFSQHDQVKPFYPLTSPGRLAKKFQAGVDAGIVREAAHRYPRRKIGPPVVRRQGANNGLQRHAGVGWRVLHEEILPALSPASGRYRTSRPSYLRASETARRRPIRMP